MACQKMKNKKSYCFYDIPCIMVMQQKKQCDCQELLFTFKDLALLHSVLGKNISFMQEKPNLKAVETGLAIG